MNKNSLITLLVVSLIVVTSIALYLNKSNTGYSVPTPTPESSSTETSAPQANQPASAREAALPIIFTDSNAAVSSSAAVVSGKVTPNGAQTSYWYDYGKTTALDNHTSSQAIGSGFIDIPAPAYISGLSANTLYYFRLSAQNRYGTVNGATYSFTTNNNPPPQAAAPTTRTDAATNVSRTTANVKGAVNPNNSQTSFWFEYGETNDLGNTTAFQSAGSEGSLVTVSLSLSDLKPLTKYYFRLNAQNKYGTVNGAILSFTTQGPAASATPSATTDAASSIGTGSATLNGRIVPNAADTEYWFEYGQDSLLTVIMSSTNRKQISGYDKMHVEDSINGLARNTKYFYRLVARNSYGTSNGDIMTFRTKQ